MANTSKAYEKTTATVQPQWVFSRNIEQAYIEKSTEGKRVVPAKNFQAIREFGEATPITLGSSSSSFKNLDLT